MDEIERGKRAELDVYDDVCEITTLPEDIIFKYELPFPTYEQIQEMIDKARMTGLITPEQLEEYAQNALYNMFFNEVKNGKSSI